MTSRLEWGSHPRPESNTQLPSAEGKSAQTLSADDLGMLLLHIHECRQIIWQNRRRFRGGLLRNLTEDLAELAGERWANSMITNDTSSFYATYQAFYALLDFHSGPVSLTQQLQIVNRMSRVYLFMKPRSTFVTKIWHAHNTCIYNPAVHLHFGLSKKTGAIKLNNQ